MKDADEPGRERRPGPPSEERVRLELVLFADLVLRLEKENRLAEALPFVLSRLGDLRQLLFDYEVRATERLLPIEDPHERAKVPHHTDMIVGSKVKVLQDVSGLKPHVFNIDQGVDTCQSHCRLDRVVRWQ